MKGNWMGSTNGAKFNLLRNKGSLINIATGTNAIMGLDITFFDIR